MEAVGFEDGRFEGWTEFYTSPETRGAHFFARKPPRAERRGTAAAAFAVAAVAAVLLAFAFS